MALPDAYTLKPGAIPGYFDAILDAQAPERFSQRFLEKLGFKSTNDRLLISILKELGFVDTDGVPTERYYRFHDRSQWQKVLAEGIREAYSDLYAVNQEAHTLSVEDATNKLRTLYKGSKSDQVISRIARTFTALCEIADFTEIKVSRATAETQKQQNVVVTQATAVAPGNGEAAIPTRRTAVALDSLQYHINIVLPDSRDQAVYDAIFKSLRDHLG